MRWGSSRLLCVAAAGAVALSGAVLAMQPAAAQTVTCPTVAAGTGTVTPAAASGVDWSGCDLSGADLSGLNVAQMSLAGADLQGADLSNSSFPLTDFTNANIADANVGNTNLSEATLAGIQSGGLVGQTDALPMDFTLRAGYVFGPGVDLQGATVSGVGLNDLDLAGANLTGQNLAGSDLSNSDLSGATLTGVTLAGADLNGTNLASTDLIGVDLTGAQVIYTQFEDDNLSGRNFAHGGCDWCSFAGANLSNTDFKDATLGGSSLTSANLDGANFADADLSSTGMAGATFVGATLTGVSSGWITGSPQSLPTGWSDVDGYLIGPGAQLGGVNLSGQVLFNADLARADLEDANLTAVNLSAAQLGAADLTGANLTRANLTGAELSSGSAVMSHVTWTRATCPDGKVSSSHGCFPATTRVSRGPALAVTATTGVPGSSDRLSGTGFRKHELLVIAFGKSRRVRVKTSGRGAFGPVTLTVASSAPAGAEPIDATAKARGQAAAAWFTVQSPWTQPGFGPALNADNSTEDGLTTATVGKLRRAWSLTPTWTAQPALADASPPPVANGLAFVTGAEGPLYAVSTATGKVEWNWSADLSNLESHNYSAPTLANGVIYVNVGGSVYAIGDNGQPYWPIPQQMYSLPPASPYSFTSAPTVANGTVYVAGNVVRALNAATGATDWTASTLPGLSADGSCNQPATAAGVVYASCNNGYLYALNAATGAVLWSYATPDAGLAAPAVAGGAVYVEDTAGSDVYAISTKTHGLLWQDVTPAPSNSLGTTPVIVGRSVYVGAAQSLIAYNASTGKQLWATKLENAAPVSESPTAAGGVVYELAGFNTEYGVDAATGKVLWSYKGGYPTSATVAALQSSPIIANGSLYFATSLGGLESFGLR